MAFSELHRRFGVPGVVKIDEGRSALPRVTVTSDLASAEIYFHGAHLTAFQPRGAKPVLFMSKESSFDPVKPIRGGVPVIYPWFGAKAGSPESPTHGIARIRHWDLESCSVQADRAVRVVFSLALDAATLRMTFTIAHSLEMELEVRAAAAPLTFEEALHTYFVVGDVRQVSVEGLQGVEYIDKVDGFKRKTQAAEPIRITGETDRVYLNTLGSCVIRDPVLARSITVDKESSGTTVVWNPWIAKAKAMADFGDEEWPQMICVETANVGEGAVRLEAAQTHRMKTRIRVS